MAEMNNIVKNWHVAPILFGVVLCTLFIACRLNSSASSAPNVTFITLQNKHISMASLKGKVVLVSFWATYCPGCKKEMPDLINTYNHYKNKGLEVIAVAVQDDPPINVVNYAADKKLPFPVMDDGLGQVTAAFGGIEGTPTAFIYDKNGKLLQRITGVIDFAKLRIMLEKELS